MNKALPIYSIFFMLILVSGCYYDNEETLYHPTLLGECDTTNVTYSGTIAPIMASYCTSCHGATAVSDGDGIDLRTYNDVKSNIVRVYGAMSGDPDYMLMPNGVKLDNCTILKVKIWQENDMPQ